MSAETIPASVHSRRIAQAALVFCTLAAGILWQERIGDRSFSETAPRPIADFRLVPVRVHLLRAEGMPAVGTTLTSSDIERLFRKANGIWHPAGIHLWLESVVEEAPAAVEDPHVASLQSVGELMPLRPAKSRGPGMFHVYFVGHMGVNGIYIARDAIFVQQAAALREVEGGIDEPLPRVMAHELGHAMGLEHRQARTNLMASGTTGTSLNDAEVGTARATCDRIDWISSTALFLDGADRLRKERKTAGANSRYRAVLDLPGDGPLKARAKSALPSS